VTHDQTEAMTMADRIVLMRGGKIEQLGTPAEPYEPPAPAFAASFIGAPPMNLMEVPGTEGTVGVRPENLRLSSDGLAAVVESVEYLGADSLVAARVGAKDVLVRIPGHATVKTGDSIRISWDRQHEHRFDNHGGRQQ